MIYKFNLVSDEVDNFKREIDIDADDTFLSLRNAICESVNYDKNQMNSFFICDDNWEKEKEITLEDMGSDSSEDVYLMEDSVISDFVEDEGQKLLFVFDYMTDRAFFLALKESLPGQSLSAPLCTMAMGTPPPQDIDIDEFNAKVDTKTATDDFMDEAFYGEDGYNDDEFDAAGYEEMSFDE